MASPTQDDDDLDDADADDDDDDEDQVPIAVALAASRKKADDKRKKPRKNLLELKRMSEQVPYVSEATIQFNKTIADAKTMLAANAALALAANAASAATGEVVAAASSDAGDSKKKRGRPKGSTNRKGVNPKKSSGGSANYSLLEDIQIAKAWASVTLDPILGTNQKGDQFWTKVHEKYQIFMEKEDRACLEIHPRNPNSLKERFQRNIQKQVNVFNPFYISVKRVVKSGWNERDYMNLALNKYL